MTGTAMLEITGLSHAFGAPEPARAGSGATCRSTCPRPRDQITTKELPAFVRLRTEVSRLVRDQEGGPGGPGDSGEAGGAEYWGRERNRSRAARASQE
jgi:hypothetical protein